MDALVNFVRENPEYAIGGVIATLLLVVIVLKAGSSPAPPVKQSSKKKKAAATATSTGDKGGKKSSQQTQSSKKGGKESKSNSKSVAVAAKTQSNGVAAATETTGTKKKKKKKSKSKKKVADVNSATTSNNSRSIAEEAAPALVEEDSDDDDDDHLLAARLLNPAALRKTGAAAAVAAAEEGSKKKKKKKKKAKKSNSPQDNSTESSNAAATQNAATGDWETVGRGAGGSVTVDTVITADGSPQPIRVTLEQEDIPVLIGPKGATIQNMQSISGARLDINKNPSGASSTLIISADTIDSQSLALAQVQSLLTAAQEERKRATAHTVTLVAADINGGDGVKAIIGRAGGTIKNIQGSTGTSIDANVERGEVVITGPSLEGVNRAATLCRHAVFGEAQEIVQLGSRAMVLVVYGKDYQKIRQMQDESGAKLDIEKGGTTLKISGPTDAVSTAKKMVAAWVDYNKGISFEVDVEKVGAIYGKAGANIRRIQEKTGAYVEVNQEAQEKVLKCSILGEPASVAAAKAMFQKSLDGEAIELKAGEIQISLDLGVGTPAVIGRGGSKIAELEKRHSVKIFINSGSQGCSIVGTKENAESAKKTVEAIIKPVIDEQKMRLEADRLATSSNTPWRPLPQNGTWIAAEEETGW